MKPLSSGFPKDKEDNLENLYLCRVNGDELTEKSNR
jgi:hypothetical protein